MSKRDTWDKFHRLKRSRKGDYLRELKETHASNSGYIDTQRILRYIEIKTEVVEMFKRATFTLRRRKYQFSFGLLTFVAVNRLKVGDKKNEAVYREIRNAARADFQACAKKIKAGTVQLTSTGWRLRHERLQTTCQIRLPTT
jgi:hypothetical protein